METNIIIFFLVLFVAWFFFSNRNKSNSTIPQEKLDNSENDYLRWVSVLKNENPHIHEFDLFGTKAAILWKNGAREVEVVCTTSFSKGIPSTKKYDYFSFNINEWYWSGTQPRGCATQIKEQLKIVQSKIT